jgi:hypothetical protein
VRDVRAVFVEDSSHRKWRLALVSEEPGTLWHEPKIGGADRIRAIRLLWVPTVSYGSRCAMRGQPEGLDTQGTSATANWRLAACPHK